MEVWLGRFLRLRMPGAETAPLDNALEKQGPIGPTVLEPGEMGTYSRFGIRALWAAKPMFLAEQHQEREMHRLSGGGGSHERTSLCQEQRNIQGNSPENVVFL